MPRVRLLILTWYLLSPFAAAASAEDPDANFSQIKRDVLNRIARDDLSPEEVNEWIDFSEDLKEAVKDKLSTVKRIERALKNPWVFFGFAAQATFMMRFVLQIIASERRGRSYVPVAFWYFSLIGGLMLFAYALKLRDPVFVFGQGLGCFIYLRNLILIHKRRQDVNGRAADRRQRTATPTPTPDDQKT